MPWGLTRFQHSGQSHFVTFCCYHRRRLLTNDESRRIFEAALERVRRSFRLHVFGYVVMPEHVHLLLSEPQRDVGGGGSAPLKPKDGLNGPPVRLLADALKSLKQGVSRRLIGDAEHFWQKEVLRSQYSRLSAVCGKAAIHSPQSGEGGVMRTSGRLGVEQFSPLRNGL
jgi:putative transposase